MQTQGAQEQNKSRGSGLLIWPQGLRKRTPPYELALVMRQGDENEPLSQQGGTSDA